MFATVSLLDHKVLIFKSEVSLTFHLGNDMEWPVGLDSNTNLIKVDNLPFLTVGVLLIFSLNSLSFSILASSNVKSLSIIEIDEVVINESELLPPSV